jgi:hypothetical protein
VMSEARARNPTEAALQRRTSSLKNCYRTSIATNHVRWRFADENAEREATEWS